jgi:hypothetical protein
MIPGVNMYMLRVNSQLDNRTGGYCVFGRCDVGVVDGEYYSIPSLLTDSFRVSFKTAKTPHFRITVLLVTYG